MACGTASNTNIALSIQRHPGRASRRIETAYPALLKLGECRDWQEDAKNQRGQRLNQTFRPVHTELPLCSRRRKEAEFNMHATVRLLTSAATFLNPPSPARGIHILLGNNLTKVARKIGFFSALIRIAFPSASIGRDSLVLSHQSQSPFWRFLDS